jgi:hypothetical protein
VSAISTKRFEDRESPKSYLNYGDPRDGDYKTWNRDWLTVDNDIHATYSKKLNQNFKITTNIGGAQFIHRYQHYYAATDGLVVPEVYSLNNTQNPVKAETYLQEKTIRSLYGTIDFDIMDAFFLNFAYRNDWSSALPKIKSKICLSFSIFKYYDFKPCEPAKSNRLFQNLWLVGKCSK